MTKIDPRNIEISSYDYPLPDERIAKYPLAQRDQSKLLVWHPATSAEAEGTIEERHFFELPDQIPAGSMIVFNKIDAYSWVEHEEDDLSPIKKNEVPLEDLKRTWMAKVNENKNENNWGCLFISAREKENMEEFRETIYKKVRELHVQKYPYNDFLYNDYSE